MTMQIYMCTSSTCCKGHGTLGKGVGVISIVANVRPVADTLKRICRIFAAEDLFAGPAKPKLDTYPPCSSAVPGSNT